MSHHGSRIFFFIFSNYTLTKNDKRKPYIVILDRFRLRHNRAKTTCDDDFDDNYGLRLLSFLIIGQYYRIVVGISGFISRPDSYLRFVLFINLCV